MEIVINNRLLITFPYAFNKSLIIFKHVLRKNNKINENKLNQRIQKI